MFLLVRRKTERKINFEQFQKALELVAEKKYGNKDSVGKLKEKITAGKGPGTSGATVRESLFAVQIRQHFPHLFPNLVAQNIWIYL